MEIPYESVPCPQCSLIFYAPKEFFDSHRRTKKSFYCPSGHTMSYSESTEEQLRSKLKMKQTYVDQLLSEASDRDKEIRKLERKLTERNRAKRPGKS